MKRVLKGVAICSLSLVLGKTLMFSNSISNYEVKNDIKREKEIYDDFDPSTQCIKESDISTKVVGYDKQGNEVHLNDLKAVVQYYYGDSPIGDVCDNPNLDLKASISACELEGWYYDSALTQKVNGTKIGDALGNPQIEIKKDANGCITEYNYITNIYAKCKTPTEPTCPTDMNNKYSISYVIDGTTISKVDTKKGEKVNTISPVKEGYKFDGWYTDSNLTTKFDGNITLTEKYDAKNCLIGYENVILYGKWIKSDAVCEPVKDGFTLIYNTNGREAIESVKITNNGSEKISIPAREGYEFTGWYLDEKLTQKLSATTLGEIKTEKYISADGCAVGYKNVTIYAGWNKLNNPNTGDNIAIYFGLGLVLLAGSIVVTKKLCK